MPEAKRNKEEEKEVENGGSGESGKRGCRVGVGGGVRFNDDNREMKVTAAFH